MNIGIIQFNQEFENPENNIVAINEILDSSLSNEDILIFPEMTLTGFTMKSDEFAEEINGTATKFFIHLSSKLKKHIFAGIIERDGSNIYNSLVHFDPHGLIMARYRKIHPFTFSNENKFFTAGTEPVVTQIDRLNIGLSICYDLRFPELYRQYAKQKVDIMLNIANWPVPRINHWQQLLQVRAIENQCFMIGANRVGQDPYNYYNGHSAIYDPMGNEVILAVHEEGLISSQIDLEKIESMRKQFPFLADMKLV
ncbi:MAG: carbon-nitrogen family hydrolase [Melioribacteraceae bacterium]|nr:carbon-nitrogen family hydrolase [Melioribacteraceae bacterium]MCF8263625.1 carbon-nitrogen family hydrolase [Melioribacteraceae bacterium]MCF8431338.1 carbon-nitrogen family hydrolase [Melioribacteraceae bacterium]